MNGGIFARGGDVRAGSPPFGDEASRASFFAVRGIALRGYDLPVSGGGRTYIYSRKGLNATNIRNKTQALRIDEKPIILYFPIAIEHYMSYNKMKSKSICACELSADRPGQRYLEVKR